MTCRLSVTMWAWRQKRRCARGRHVWTTVVEDTDGRLPLYRWCPACNLEAPVEEQP